MGETGAPADPGARPKIGPQNREFEPLTRVFLWGRYVSGVRVIGTPPMAEWPSGRDPFELGNEVAVKHGGYSERRIAAKAAAVHDELLDVAPYLTEAKFAPAVLRYLQAAAREALLHDHISNVAAERGPGAVASRTWEQATAAARLAARLASDLGLDPIGHARIRALSAGADATEASLADLAAAGAETSGFRRLENRRSPALTEGDFQESTE